MTKEEKELAQWQIIHALKGPDGIGRCEHKCGDPVCSIGCLRSAASGGWRPYIMKGIELARKNGSPLYPLVVPDQNRSVFKCSRGRYCVDSVCQVSGCLDVPAYKFRNLIKAAQHDEVITALKK